MSIADYKYQTYFLNGSPVVQFSNNSVIDRCETLTRLCVELKRILVFITVK